MINITMATSLGVKSGGKSTSGCLMCADVMQKWCKAQISVLLVYFIRCPWSLMPHRIFCPFKCTCITLTTSNLIINLTNIYVYLYMCTYDLTKSWLQVQGQALSAFFRISTIGSRRLWLWLTGETAYAPPSRRTGVPWSQMSYGIFCRLKCP